MWDLLALPDPGTQAPLYPTAPNGQVFDEKPPRSIGSGRTEAISIGDLLVEIQALRGQVESLHQEVRRIRYDALRRPA